MIRADSIDPARLRAALERASAALLSARTVEGHWVGELSGSALSTATAVTALAVVQRESGVTLHASRITAGLDWLARNQNEDGGWGDTLKSLSNLSTTALCWAAFGSLPGAGEKFSPTVRNAEKWMTRKITTPDRPHLTPALSPPSGSGEREAAVRVNIDELARAVIARYGRDRTFSVPILTMCALAGRLGVGRDAWRHVIPLPFELAACPHSWFAALKLPVVSYALPALIAIGQARHHHRPSSNPIARMIRRLTRERTLGVLTCIQPSNGGFLEATPLTSFVTMSLAGSGQVDHPVVRLGVEFLIASQRTDGSWPIDTNLATWVTTLSVNALQGRTGVSRVPGPKGDATAQAGGGPGGDGLLDWTVGPPVLRWLLAQQYRVEHPYTHAAPGGWAWTDLPGGVPDADDTAGALLALAQLRNEDRTKSDEVRAAARAGVRWLMGLQNSDGGVPTFCRGWGALPFDRSSADLTAHAIRAWRAWKGDLPDLEIRIGQAIRKATAFLVRGQREDGSWLPLWFGNQWDPNDENPVYGTSRVLLALSQVDEPRALEMAVRWLIDAQQTDGGWGARSRQHPTVEETALSVEALTESLNAITDSEVRAAATAAVTCGTEWLIRRVEAGTWTDPSPIGFYFAKLWYYERLYPVIFTVSALNRVVRGTGAPASSSEPPAQRQE